MASTSPVQRLLGPGLALALTVAAAAGIARLAVAPQHEGPAPAQVTVAQGMAWIGPGAFLMGSDSSLAQANEKPTHSVAIDGFWMDVTHVTNDDFAQFVAETGYVTTAERAPDWETVRVQLPEGTPRPPDAVLIAGAMVFTGTPGPVRLDDYSQWWRYVPGASWRHPQGPGSSIAGKGKHPVVQVSYADAQAYASWIGKRLPTEAEWEYAARGGLEQATWSWGNELMPQGQRMANYWDTTQAPFPVATVAADTMAVASFPANGYGLHDMTGNAWQWVADWYDARYFERQARTARVMGGLHNPRGPQAAWDPDDRGVPMHAPKRVIRGGSFLCNEDYCLSYRPSARRGSDPWSPMSHVGFRLVKDAPGPGGSK